MRKVSTILLYSQRLRLCFNYLITSSHQNIAKSKWLHTAHAKFDDKPNKYDDERLNRTWMGSMTNIWEFLLVPSERTIYHTIKRKHIQYFCTLLAYFGFDIAKCICSVSFKLDIRKKLCQHVDVIHWF